MRLRYHFADSKSKPHPFRVKSTWQPQPSVALESHLELIKSEIASIGFHDIKGNLTERQRQELLMLRANKRVNLKRADKGSTTIVIDTLDKINEGTQPMVSYTATKVKYIFNTLFKNGHIDKMTYQWLSQGQNPPRILEFYTLTEIHKAAPVGRPIVSGSGGPAELISSFVDSLLQPIAKKQEPCIKDTTHFINFIENTFIPDNAILAALDVCSLYTNKEEGIQVIGQHYEEHYQTYPPIPTLVLGELMSLILKENSFQFNDKHYLQTHGITMGIIMTVDFVVIFMAHVKRLLLAKSPYKLILWKRFIDIFSVWTKGEVEINNFVQFANDFHPVIKFTCEMSSERIVFCDTDVFKGSRFVNSNLLNVKSHFKLTKTFSNIHMSPLATPSLSRRGLLKNRRCTF